MKALNLKTTLLLLSTMMTLISCGEDEVKPQESITLTTISGEVINMDGVWSSDCELTNQNVILKETMTFNNGNLRIDINGYETMDCDGSPIFSELVQITFNTSGTTQVTFENEELTVNKIDGRATYSDGRTESFKQVFLIDDSGADFHLYHGLFGDDGGAVDFDGYPIEIIPLSLVKNNP